MCQIRSRLAVADGRAHRLCLVLRPSRHLAASQQFGRFRSEADISVRFLEPDL
jgi:hypothetical protein